MTQGARTGIVPRPLSRNSTDRLSPSYIQIFRKQVVTIFPELGKRLSGRFTANPAIRLDAAPICTFTFDDCPRSALENGGRLLAERGAAGTFFVTGSWLADGSAKHRHMLSPDDLRKLVASGHELGCHTYAHQSVRGLSRNSLRADLDRNRELLLAASGAESLVTFSYPFGEASWLAKHLIATRFAAARGVRPGINGRVVDLSQLRATPIMSNGFSPDGLRASIRKTVRKRGWLIFYTHGVTEARQPWGCTIEQFTVVLDLVADAGVKILPMRSAVGRIMHRG